MVLAVPFFGLWMAWRVASLARMHSLLCCCGAMCGLYCRVRSGVPACPVPLPACRRCGKFSLTSAAPTVCVANFRLCARTPQRVCRLVPLCCVRLGVPCKGVRGGKMGSNKSLRSKQKRACRVWHTSISPVSSWGQPMASAHKQQGVGARELRERRARAGRRERQKGVLHGSTVLHGAHGQPETMAQSASMCAVTEGASAGSVTVASTLSVRAAPLATVMCSPASFPRRRWDL